jgi:PAS domain-containing protein
MLLLSRHQNAGQNHNIKIGDRSFENVVGTTVTNQILIQEEIKRRLNSGNACYHSVQNRLSSCLLLENEKIRLYKTIILPAEHRLRVFENRVLRRIFGLKRDEVIGSWRKLHNEELHNLYRLPSIIGMIKSRRMRWAGLVAYMGEGRWETRNPYRILVG